MDTCVCVCLLEPTFSRNLGTIHVAYIDVFVPCSHHGSTVCCLCCVHIERKCLSKWLD